MKITKISLYSIPVNASAGQTRYGANQKIDISLNTLIIRLDTNEGLIGWGEVCTPPPFYLPTLPSGAMNGIEYIAPLIIGRDPLNINAIIADVNKALRGHANAKTGLDMALWDLRAKLDQAPLIDLWGGCVATKVPVLEVIHIGTIDEMIVSLEKHRSRGYSRFQVKLASTTPEEDIRIICEILKCAKENERIWFDPNRGWLIEDAIRIVAAVKNSNFTPMIENPCETYEECRAVARRTGLSLILDEVLDSPRRFIEAVHDEAMDVATLKLSNVGGLTSARFMCDLGIALGVSVRIEDYFGTGILLSAVTHLAMSLPERFVFGLYDYVRPEVPVVMNPLKVENGYISLPTNGGPGLGVEINEDVIGQPVRVFT